MAEKVGAVNSSAARRKRGKKIVHRVSVEARVGTGDIATGVAVVTSVFTGGTVNDLELLDPRVGRSRAKKGSNSCSSDDELHCDRWVWFDVL